MVCAKVSTVAVRYPRAAIGTAMVTNVSSGEARSVAPASSGPRPMVSNAACSGCTVNGSE